MVVIPKGLEKVSAPLLPAFYLKIRMHQRSTDRGSRSFITLWISITRITFVSDMILQL